MTAHLLYGAHVRANGIRQHYLRYGGSGTPLVLVWGFVAERLAMRFDVYVLDVRGRGLSSSGPDLNYGLDAMADDLSSFVAALGLGDVTVLGHSMGARIAIRTAIRNAVGFARLVLVDPPVSGPRRRPYPTKLAWCVDSIRLAEQGMDAEAIRSSVQPGPRSNFAFAPNGSPLATSQRSSRPTTASTPTTFTLI